MCDKSGGSGTKTVTEREAVLRERAAYACGIHDGIYDDTMFTHNCHEKARKLYPLPRVERSRVVRDTTGMCKTEWKLEGGLLWHRPDANFSWRRCATDDSGMFVYTERVRLLADLLANPTELVEDDDA